MSSSTSAASAGDGRAVMSLLSKRLRTGSWFGRLWSTSGVLTDGEQLEPLGVVRLGQAAALLEFKTSLGFAWC